MVALPSSFRPHQGERRQCSVETQQEWARHTRCIRGAKFLVDGHYMCRLHAAYAALDYVLAQTKENAR